jgi:hypothetical protein
MEKELIENPTRVRVPKSHPKLLAFRHTDRSVLLIHFVSVSQPESRYCEYLAVKDLVLEALSD